MGLQPIPAAWRNAVCSALKQGTKLASFTATGAQLWQDQFPDAFRYQLDDALIRALSDSNLGGCPVPMDNPPGETWEFFFQFRGAKLYGKLLLRDDKKRMVIYSAHRPKKTTLRCE